MTQDTHPRSVDANSGWVAIEALLSALAARGLHDPDRAIEVAALAARVGGALQISSADARAVEELVALHDVGLIGIPDELLRKPGTLDADEQRRLAEHPRIGAAIVAALPGLEPLAPLVAAEHERWDGTGYPNGLAGEEIPLPSRIVLACDAYAAMRRARPDRPALDHEVAVAVLSRNAGTQFCPVTVAALLDVLAHPDVLGTVPAAEPPPATTEPPLTVAPARPASPAPAPVATVTGEPGTDAPWLRPRSSTYPMPVPVVDTGTPRDVAPRLPLAVKAASAAVGLAVGVWWTLPIKSVARACPPEGEGAGWCTLQKAWLPAIVQIEGTMIAAVLLTWLVLIAIPRWMGRTPPADARDWAKHDEAVRRAAGRTVRGATYSDPPPLSS